MLQIHSRDWFYGDAGPKWKGCSHTIHNDGKCQKYLFFALPCEKPGSERRDYIIRGRSSVPQTDRRTRQTSSQVYGQSVNSRRKSCNSNLSSIAVSSIDTFLLYDANPRRQEIIPAGIKPLELIAAFYGEFSCESRETGLRDMRKEGRRVRPTPLMPAYFATRRAKRQRLDSRCARYFSRATFHAYGIDDDFSTGRLSRCSTDGLLRWHLVRLS